MKRFTLFAALLGALLLLASAPALAKLKVSVVVTVKNDVVQGQLERALQARINSTERYTVVNSMGAADFILAVDCIVLQTEQGYKSGVVCNSTVSFFPFNTGLYTDLGLARAMVVSPLQNMSYIAEGLIDTFINGTTDEALDSNRSLLRYIVRAHCTSNPTDCAPQK